MAVEFDDGTRRILDGRNFATVATVGPDGAPQSSVVWFQRDGDTLVFSTTATRQKARNIARDPRVSVNVFDLDNPYDSVEVRGRAELAEDAERALPRELSHRYLGEDPPPEHADVERLVVRVVPETVNRFTA
jgi:PPOX class probable F420-dependent enzyme